MVAKGGVESCRAHTSATIIDYVASPEATTELLVMIRVDLGGLLSSV